MIHPTSFIAPGAVVLGDVALGRDASVWYNCVIRADMAPIHIGDDTNVQDLSVVHVDEGVPCTIGNRVAVGHRAIIHGCTIADDVLVGMGAVVLNEAVVGTGSLIGAGAVVLEGTRIPPRSLVVGVPARVAREMTDADADRIRATWQHYVQEARRHRSGSLVRHPASPTTHM